MPHPHKHKPETQEKEPRSQSLTIACGIFALIFAGGFFVCSYAYWSAQGTSCHLKMGTAYISDEIMNAILRDVCSYFERSVSDKNKPAVGSAFFAILGLISLIVAWFTFASIDDKQPRDWQKP